MSFVAIPRHSPHCLIELIPNGALYTPRFDDPKSTARGGGVSADKFTNADMLWGLRFYGTLRELFGSIRPL